MGMEFLRFMSDLEVKDTHDRSVILAKRLIDKGVELLVEIEPRVTIITHFENNFRRRVATLNITNPNNAKEAFEYLEKLYIEMEDK